MSHDTDKLIRQLSLVAFLMAERRAITARDVKSNVEGYSEMSDEAFARRFYSDRAELIALGVPLHSQRDEFTGEELYTLREEQYFLPPLELSNDELAALQTGLYMLEGKFAYAEPLRLALQNLTLGRAGFSQAPTATAVQVEVLDPDYSPELAGRLAKLENAISKQRTVKFGYLALSTGAEKERTLNPYALYNERGSWYVVGQDLDRDDIRTFKVSRIRGDIRFATRRERDFKIPPDFDVSRYRGRPNWQIGDLEGEARIEVPGDTAWWVERTYGEHGRLEDGVFVTDYSNLGLLAAWVLRQDGRAVPVEPDGLRREVAASLRRIRDAHEGAPSVPTTKPARARAEAAPERPAGPVAPERFAVLQALLAFLLAACGDERDAEVPSQELVDRFHIPHDQLQEHLSLLNLVNFGGGCYTVYAELDEEAGVVRVDKETFGDIFRAPPRLTPLEARAIRLALEFVGPIIGAEANSALANVRKHLEDTFGQFDLTQTPEPEPGVGEGLVETLSKGARDRRLAEIEHKKEGETAVSRRVVEVYSIERKLPHWYVHTWDRTADGPRSFRLDRIRSATLSKERFDPRPDFDPHWLQDTRTIRIWYSPQIAEWELEHSGNLERLADGSAVGELHVGTADWLVQHVFELRGAAEVLEPPDMRKAIAARARELAKELGVDRLRVPA